MIVTRTFLFIWLAALTLSSVAFHSSHGDQKRLTVEEARQLAQKVPATNPQLITALSDPDPRIGLKAQQALAEQGEKVVPLLVDALAKTKWDYGMGSFMCGDRPVLNKKDLGTSISMTLWLTLVNYVPREPFLKLVDALSQHESGRVRYVAYRAIHAKRKRGISSKLKNEATIKCLDDPYVPLCRRAYREVNDSLKADHEFIGEFEKRLGGKGDARAPMLMAMGKWMRLSGKYELGMQTLLSWASDADDELAQAACEELYFVFDPAQKETNDKLLKPLTAKWSDALRSGDMRSVAPLIFCHRYIRGHPPTENDLAVFARFIEGGRGTRIEIAPTLLGNLLDASVSEPIRTRAWELLVASVRQRHNDRLALAAAHEIPRHDNGLKSLNAALAIKIEDDPPPPPRRAVQGARSAFQLPAAWKETASREMAARFRGWRPPMEWSLRDWESAYYLNVAYFGKDEAVKFLADFGKFVAALPDERSSHADEERFIKHVIYAHKTLGGAATWPVYWNYITGARTGAKDRFLTVTQSFLTDRNQPEELRKKLSDFLYERLADPTEDARFRATVMQIVQATGHDLKRFVPLALEVHLSDPEWNLWTKSLLFLQAHASLSDKVNTEFVRRQTDRILRTENLPWWCAPNALSAYSRMRQPQRGYINQLITWLETIPRPKLLSEGYVTTCGRVNWGPYPVVDPRIEVIQHLRRATGVDYGGNAKAWRAWYQNRFGR